MISQIRLVVNVVFFLLYAFPASGFCVDVSERSVCSIFICRLITRKKEYNYIRWVERKKAGKSKNKRSSKELKLFIDIYIYTHEYVYTSIYIGMPVDN
jgi:hypothetical protein